METWLGNVLNLENSFFFSNVLLIIMISLFGGECEVFVTHNTTFFIRPKISSSARASVWVDKLFTLCVNSPFWVLVLFKIICINFYLLHVRRLACLIHPIQNLKVALPWVGGFEFGFCLNYLNLFLSIECRGRIVVLSFIQMRIWK